jgi:hypothetical protein
MDEPEDVLERKIAQASCIAQYAPTDLCLPTVVAALYLGSLSSCTMRRFPLFRAAMQFMGIL